MHDASSTVFGPNTSRPALCKAAGEPLPSSYMATCIPEALHCICHAACWRVASPVTFSTSMKPFTLSALTHGQSQQVWLVPATRAWAAAHGDGVKYPDSKQRGHAPALQDTSPGVIEPTDRERTNCCCKQHGPGRMKRAEAGVSLAVHPAAAVPAGLGWQNTGHVEHLARDSHGGRSKRQLRG